MKTCTQVFEAKDLFFIKGKGYVITENRLVREQEYFVDYHNRQIFQWIKGNGIHKGKSTYCDVIIATDTTFSLSGIPQFEYLSGADDKYDELLELTKNNSIDHHALFTKSLLSIGKSLWKRIFNIGYNAASEKLYTEADMLAIAYTVKKTNLISKAKSPEELISIVGDYCKSLKSTQGSRKVEVEYLSQKDWHDELSLPEFVKYFKEMQLIDFGNGIGESDAKEMYDTYKKPKIYSDRLINVKFNNL